MAWSKEMTCRNFEVCHALSRCHAKRVGLESPFLERCFWYQLSNIGCQRDIVTALTIQDYSQSHVTMSRCHAKRVGLESPFLERFFRYQLSNIGCQRDIVTALTIQDYSQSHVTMSRKKGRFGKSFPREIFQVPTFQYIGCQRDIVTASTSGGVRC